MAAMALVSLALTPKDPALSPKSKHPCPIFGASVDGINAKHSHPFLALIPIELYKKTKQHFNTTFLIEE
jgi:hypothetical protein